VAREIKGLSLRIAKSGKISAVKKKGSRVEIAAA
jgi:hypothetical protein